MLIKVKSAFKLLTQLMQKMLNDQPHQIVNPYLSLSKILLATFALIFCLCWNLAQKSRPKTVHVRAFSPPSQLRVTRVACNRAAVQGRVESTDTQHSVIRAAC